MVYNVRVIVELKTAFEKMLEWKSLKFSKYQSLQYYQKH